VDPYVARVARDISGKSDPRGCCLRVRTGVDHGAALRLLSEERDFALDRLGVSRNPGTMVTQILCLVELLIEELGEAVELRVLNLAQGGNGIVAQAIESAVAVLLGLYPRTFEGLQYNPT